MEAIEAKNIQVDLPPMATDIRTFILLMKDLFIQLSVVILITLAMIPRLLQ
jgi:hypothetical protein